MSDELLAGLSGSIITLLGVVLTLWHSQQVHERHLAEERVKLRHEREFATRQEVFAQVVESSNRFVQYLQGLPNAPASQEVSAESKELATALAKLHLYATLPVIECAANLGRMVFTVYALAMKARLPALFIGEDLKALDLQIANIKQLTEALQQEIAAFMQRNDSSEAIRSRQELLAKHFRALAALHDDKLAKVKLQYACVESTRDNILQATPAISAAQQNLLLALRNDLGFQIDGDRYKAFMEKESREMMENLQRFIDEVRSEIQAKINS